MQQIYTTLPSSRFNVAYYAGGFYEFSTKTKMQQWLQLHPGAQGYSCNNQGILDSWKNKMRQQNNSHTSQPKSWKEMTPDEIAQCYPEIKVRQRKLKKTTKNCGNCVKYRPPEDIDAKCGTCGDRVVYDRSIARHCIGYQSKHEVHLFKQHERQVHKLLGPDKKYLHMEGDPHNPTVHFHCKNVTKTMS